MDILSEMSIKPENATITRMRRDLIAFKTTIASFEESLNQISCDYNVVNEQKDSYLAERESLVSENETLVYELESLKLENNTHIEQKDEFKRQNDDLRYENDMLYQKLNEKDLINRKALEFAQNVLDNNNTNGLQNFVSSLPTFSDQMVLGQKSNSVTTLGSLAEIRGMRLTKSKEEKIVNPSHFNQNSRETSTSDGTFYDAFSHRSSVANDSVRPKLQQNVISSTINLSPNLTQSDLQTVSSKTCSLDISDNLKLKLVKVKTRQIIPVTIAYIDNPSSFWLHIDQKLVNSIFYSLQLKQQEMEDLGNCKLTSADITIGMYCAAIYSGDGKWYRAQVIDINYGNEIEKDSIKTIEVLFIDWGNREHLPLSKVMKLSHELKKRKQAIHCYCQGIGFESIKWPEKTIEEFKNSLEDKRLAANFQEPHKVSEVLNSVIFPVDLMIIFENGERENIANYLPIPEFVDSEEDENNLIDLVDEKNAIVYQSNSQNKENKGVIKNLNLDLSKKSNKQNVPQNLSQSVPQIVSKTLTPSLPQHSSQPLSRHSCQLKSNSRNSDFVVHTIPPPIVPDSSEGLIVILTHIKSPSDFFVQINHRTNSLNTEELDENLFLYYSGITERKTRVEDVTIGSFWSCQYSSDQRWYRSRVLQMIDDKALIIYIDYGNEEWVEIKELLPLTKDFASHPALAVNCCLSSVSPNAGIKWSKESIDYFIKLSGFNDELMLTAYIGKNPLNFSLDSKLEIFLWANESKEHHSRDILINSKLVIKKFAKTESMEWVKEAERADRETTPPESTPQIIEMAYGRTRTNESSNKQMNKMNILPELENENSEDDDDWDPMADDAFCDNNNYTVIADDPATLTLGFHPQERRTCKYYGTINGCRSKDFCTFLHVHPDKRFAITDSEEQFLKTDELKLNFGSRVLVLVNGVQSPSSFYAFLPFGSKPFSESDIKKVSNTANLTEYSDKLKDICSELMSYYSQISKNNNISHSVGTLVAFKNEKTGVFYRGRVIGLEINDHLEISNIDLGNTQCVHRKLIFRLEKIFTRIPNLAINCSLAGIHPIDINSYVWTEDAVKAFADLTLNKIFCAEILSGCNNKIAVNLIDFSNHKKEYISSKMVDKKFARFESNAMRETINSEEDEIYSSDLE